MHTQVVRRWRLSKLQCFDPFTDLYVWLGQIRDQQLPAQCIIDEEGRGVMLMAQPLAQPGYIRFQIEPWMSGQSAMSMSLEVLTSDLIEAFVDGIMDFIATLENQTSFTYVPSLQNLHWQALLKPIELPGQDWILRLALHGGGHGRVPETGRETVWEKLSDRQQWLAKTHTVLHRIALIASRGQTDKAFALVDLYQHILVDLALDELDVPWYEAREGTIDQTYGELDLPWHRTATVERQKRIAQARVNTLSIGQIVDGTVRSLKRSGVWIDVGGCRGLLHKNDISCLSVETIGDIFQEDDWVRAIIVDLDPERGRLTLSTRELEVEPGDMLKDPMMVYRTAEQSVIKKQEKT